MLVELPGRLHGGIVTSLFSLQYKPPLPRKKSGQTDEGGHTPTGASVVMKNSNFSATYTVSSPPDGGKALLTRHIQDLLLLGTTVLTRQEQCIRKVQSC